MSWRLFTHVDLRRRSDTYQPNSSPKNAIMPEDSLCWFSWESVKNCDPWNFFCTFDKIKDGGKSIMTHYDVIGCSAFLRYVFTISWAMGHHISIRKNSVLIKVNYVTFAAKLITFLKEYSFVVFLYLDLLFTKRWVKSLNYLYFGEAGIFYLNFTAMNFALQYEIRNKC